jgi:zinc-finger of transposase IS204/IS1001/IS1096/IS1165
MKDAHMSPPVGSAPSETTEPSPEGKTRARHYGIQHDAGHPGATTIGFTFTPAGVVIRLRRRRRKLRCPCGHETSACYDSSIRRWRHLDLGACPLLLEAEIRRLACRRCGRIRTEEVP